MFERYTEKARRVVFFARYEASQYGAKEIGTEHLLLGLMREDRMLMNQFLGPKAGRVDLRMDMEREITQGERLSTAVEIPLSAEGKKVLTLAGEEAQRLGSRQVGTEHLLLALLGVKGSLAERTLVARRLKLDEIRLTLAVEPSRDPEPQIIESHPGLEASGGTNQLSGRLELDEQRGSASDILRKTLPSSIRRESAGHEPKFEKTFEVLFANYAKKNATYFVEAAPVHSDETFVVSVLWKNALLASEGRGWMHRMGMVWVMTEDTWQIGFVQVTVVAPGTEER